MADHSSDAFAQLTLFGLWLPSLNAQINRKTIIGVR